MENDRKSPLPLLYSERRQPLSQRDFDILEEAFATILSLDGGARETFVRDFGRSRPHLAAQLKKLLEADSDKEESIHVSLSFLLKQAASFADANWTGRRLGPWQIIAEHARGGMSRVFLAERADQSYTQRTVVKIMHVQLLGEEAALRFRQETQLLANFKHPSIARLLDAGTTEESLPYLVMEYVEGETIDAYCQKHSLSLRQRIALFSQVCDAVDYAHRNLIVHCDLKPGNILITEDGTVKLLDFGIATQISVDAKDQMAEGAIAFTMGFAAPEQLTGGAISVATDIYSLGNILYRLLTDASPYNEAPERQSDLRDAIIGGNVVRAEALNKSLRGDLEAILSKSMHLDPSMRYPDVRALSDDLRSYLTSHPISVRRHDLGYRMLQFSRRHRWALGASVAGAMGAVVAGHLYISNIVEARNTAETALRDAEAASTFLASLFSEANPQKSKGETLTAEGLLDSASEEISKTAMTPSRRARLLLTIAASYTNLGKPQTALPLLAQAVSALDSVGSGNDILRAQVMIASSEAHRLSGDAGMAEADVKEALALLGEPDAEDSDTRIDALTRLGVILFDQRTRNDEAAGALGEALRLHRASGRSEDSALADILGNLGIIRDRLHEFDKAEPLLREAIKVSYHTDGPNHPNTIIRIGNLGLMLTRVGRFEEAEIYLRDARTLAAEVWPADHLQISYFSRAHAFVLGRLGNLDEGLAEYREACESVMRHAGPDSLALVACHGGLATVLIDRNEYSAAGSLLSGALEVALAKGEAGLYQAGRIRTNIGRLRLAEGKASEALAVLSQAEPSYPYLNPGDLFEARLLLAQANSMLGQYAAAEALYGTLKKDQRSSLQSAQLALGLAAHARRTQQIETAVREAERALSEASASLPDGNWMLAEYHDELARALAAAGRLEQSEAEAEVARKLLLNRIFASDSR